MLFCRFWGRLLELVRAARGAPLTLGPLEREGEVCARVSFVVSRDSAYYCYSLFCSLFLVLHLFVSSR